MVRVCGVACLASSCVEIASTMRCELTALE